jgi:hypothetical protein
MPVKVKTAVESRECAFYRMGLDFFNNRKFENNILSIGDNELTHTPYKASISKGTVEVIHAFSNTPSNTLGSLKKNNY